MFQFKSKSTKISRLCTIYFALAAVFMASCTGAGSNNEERTTMITATDSLWRDMSAIKKMFGYKTDELQERRHYMDSLLQHLKFADGSKISEADQRMVSQYNSIRRVYRDFGPRYTSAVVDAEDLYFQIKALEKQVKAGKFDGKAGEFGKDYRKLKAELGALRSELEEVTGKVNAVEPTFQRIGPKVEALVESLN